MPTTTLNPIADTYLDEANSSSNFGGYSIQVGNKFDVYGRRKHGLLRFDLSSIPAEAIVTSAKLRMYWNDVHLGTGGGDYEVRAYRCLSANWTEDGATWNERYADMPWVLAGCSSTDNDYDTNVRGYFQFWTYGGEGNEGDGWYDAELGAFTGGEGRALARDELSDFALFLCLRTEDYGPCCGYGGELSQYEVWSAPRGGGALAPSLSITWEYPSGIGWKPGSRKFRFSPCGGYYPCCGYYYCYGSYYCCHCNYFSYGGLSPCCQHVTLSGFTGDNEIQEFLNRTWRLSSCSTPYPGGYYCYDAYCPPCTWRAIYCTPTGEEFDEETRCIDLRIWNDGTAEAPAYKAILTVEGSTFEKDLGAAKPYILDNLGTMTRTGGSEGAASVTAELEEQECETFVWNCHQYPFRCDRAKKYYLIEIAGLVDTAGSCAHLLNGSFLVVYFPNSGSAWCTWYYLYPEEQEVCFGFPLEGMWLEGREVTGGAKQLYFWAGWWNVHADLLIAQKTWPVGERIPGDTLFQESLTFEPSAYLDVSGATIKVTAIN